MGAGHPGVGVVTSLTPEPGSLVLLALGGAVLAWRRGTSLAIRHWAY
jgi:hypothetical protein